MTAFEVMTAPGARLGEGPVWDERRQCLWWIDILGGLVHRLNPATGAVNAIAAGHDVGALALCDDGDLLIALPGQLVALDPETGRRVVLAPVALPGQRFNDGACDPRGRFWVGTLSYDRTPGAGALYRLAPGARLVSGGRLVPALTGVTVSNGIDWSPDGALMYYVDTETARIDVIDFGVAAGTLGTRREFAAIDPADGVPDGLAVDAEGGIWLALFGGHRVIRLDADGRLDREIRLPVSHPTSVAFGGPDLTDLYVTSATRALSAAELAEQPLAGALLRLRPGVAGRLPYRYRRSRRRRPARAEPAKALN
jgi:sugar lactone lactonase YvrE